MKTLIILLALIVSGCNTGGVSLPPLPAWKAPADGSPLLAIYVKSQASLLVPGVPVHSSDLIYTRINHEWLESYLSWTWHAAKAAGIRYTVESFNCVEFAKAFDVFANLAAAKAGVERSPLLARLVVAWDGGTRHALIGVVTDRGIYVVEPQPDAGPFRIWPLAGYPRQILSITLGDFNPI
jgi:hypothetical protein